MVKYTMKYRKRRSASTVATHACLRTLLLGRAFAGRFVYPACCFSGALICNSDQRALGLTVLKGVEIVVVGRVFEKPDDLVSIGGQ